MRAKAAPLLLRVTRSACRQARFHRDVAARVTSFHLVWKYNCSTRRNGPDPLGPLRPRRPTGMVETIGGLSLSRDAADAIRAEAAKRGTSEHAIMVEVLERWAEERSRGA